MMPIMNPDCQSGEGAGSLELSFGKRKINDLSLSLTLSMTMSAIASRIANVSVPVRKDGGSRGDKSDIILARRPPVASVVVFMWLFSPLSGMESWESLGSCGTNDVCLKYTVVNALHFYEMPSVARVKGRLPTLGVTSETIQASGMSSIRQASVLDHRAQTSR